MMTVDRPDLSDWVIHFVHDRNPSVDVSQWRELLLGEDGRGNVLSLRDFPEGEWYEAGDAPAYWVLERVLEVGYLQAGWSFRNEKATVYGPRPAVCFTEMPLSALVSYARARGDQGLVHSYGIAVRKRQLFEHGGRPAIYGLSSPHREAENSDPEVLSGPRLLADECGISTTEQYRYVATSLAGATWIDWTHEREWRWPLDACIASAPGLPIWLTESEVDYSDVVVIVKTAEEANRFEGKLVAARDAKRTNWDRAYDIQRLRRTRVLALEEATRSEDSIDDLLLHARSIAEVAEPTATDVKRVNQAICRARGAAERAARDATATWPRAKNGHIADLFGFAYVVAHDGRSAEVQALVREGHARSHGDSGYFIPITEIAPSIGPTIGVRTAAARAAADSLQEDLGVSFYVETRDD